MFQTPCRNLGVTFRFKLDQIRTIAVGIGGKPRGESGFIVSTLFNKNRVQVNANNASITNKAMKIDPDQWHNAMVEIVGNRVVVQLNGEKILDAENPTISKHPKKSLAFVVVLLACVKA